MRYSLLLTLLFLTQILSSQSNIPLGTWRTHFSYNRVNQILVEQNQVFAVSENGLFIYDKEDGSLTTISKINGLQEDGISAIGYSQELDILIIGFESGNIDVLKDNEIVNLDLVTNSQIIGSKKINHISTTIAEAFISTDYGVLRVDLNKVEISETYRELGENANQIRVNQSLINGDSIILATQEGVISSNYLNNTNLLNPANWKRNSISNGIPLTEISYISNFDNSPAAFINNDGLYTYSNGIWTRSNALQNLTVSNLKSSDGKLIVINQGGIFVLNNDLSLVEFSNQLIVSPTDADLDRTSIWVGDSTNGLITNSNGGFEQFIPTGPNTNQNVDFFTLENTVFSLPGGMSASSQPLGNTSGYNKFSQGLWQSFSEFPNQFLDITEATYFSNTDSYYFSSFGYGIMRINGQNEYTFYNSENSSLLQTGSDPNTIFISDMTESDEGLWAVNYNSEQGLHLFDGSSWQSFSLPTSRITQIINSTFYLWMVVEPSAGGGILVFDKSTNETRRLSDQPGNGGLPSNFVNTIEIDKEGIIWIGTNSGATTIASSTNIFSGTVDAITPIFENRLLLRDEEVTSIKIDGGNRKWLGTNNGAWLFNDDVTELISNFNIENSPLPSNAIVAMDIIPETGEVFFGTPEGIISYRADATEATRSHQSVKIFPNPITIDFQGVVGISGLVENAKVKITDANGRLIWDTRAAGGTASWNVQNYNGRRAASGVYFVFSSSDDGEETFVGKIAIVN